MSRPGMMCRTLRFPCNDAAEQSPEAGRGHGRMCRNEARLSSDTSEVLDGSAFYRRHTEGLLRRYVRMSMQIGRVPSCLPREYLRTRGNSRQGANFEDGVIFVHDMERCLQKLDNLAGELVARVGIQEYSRREAAEKLGMSYGRLNRKYDEAIDQLTRILLAHQLILQSDDGYRMQAYR